MATWPLSRNVAESPTLPVCLVGIMFRPSNGYIQTPSNAPGIRSDLASPGGRLAGGGATIDTLHIRHPPKAESTVLPTPASRLSSWPRAIYLRQEAASSGAGEINVSSNSWLRHPNGTSHWERRRLTSGLSRIRLTLRNGIEKNKNQTHQSMDLCRAAPAVFKCDPYRLTSRSANSDRQSPPVLRSARTRTEPERTTRAR